MKTTARAAIVGFAALLAGACSDSLTPPSIGAARVALATAGLDLDHNGYSVQVDTGPLLTVPIDGTLILTNLISGAHTVAVGGLAANCTVNGANPRTVNVVAGDTTDIAFAVGCTASFASVSAGGNRTCGVTTAGAAYCWGDGLLGDGTTAERRTPVAVLGGLTFTQISSSDYLSCALTAGGAAYCWGSNLFGQLGTGDLATEGLTPVAVVGGRQYATIDAGRSAHACALTTMGAAYCWGGNSGGLLGLGTTTGPEDCDAGPTVYPCSTVPAPVTGGLTFTALAVSSGHSCALTATGAAYCWGFNGFGALGDNTQGDRYAPVQVAGGLAFAALTVGGAHTCGLTTDGTAYCWGMNSYGQLGVGASAGPELCFAPGRGEESCSRAPVAVLGSARFASIDAGGLHTCAVTSNGVAHCWGANSSGQLGTGTMEQATTPAPVAGGLTFARVSAGEHSCGVTVANIAYCWGSNVAGQLGNGSTTTSNVPIKVAGQP